MHGVLDRCFKCLFDFGSRGDLARCCTRKKGLKEGPFLLQGQLLMATPARPRRFDGRHAQAVIRGDDAAHRADGDARMGRDLLGFARGNQRLIPDQPALAAPKAGIMEHPSFDLFGWQMSDRSRDAASHAVSLLLFTGSFLVYYLERESVLQGITGPQC
jgi:hypothetical protein